MPAAPVATYSKPAASIATYSNAVAAPSYQYVQPQAQYARAPTSSITVQPQDASVFNVIDTNGDGKISRAEFSNYVTGTTTNVVQPAVSSNFVMPSYNVVQQPAFNVIEEPKYVTAVPEFAN